MVRKKGKPKQTPDGKWSQEFEADLETIRLNPKVRPLVEGMAQMSLKTTDSKEATPVDDWTDEMVDAEVDRIVTQSERSWY